MVGPDRIHFSALEQLVLSGPSIDRTLKTTARQHERLLSQLRATDAADQVVMFPDPEEE